MTKYTFQVEPWAACVDEMRPIWQLHWAEIALDKELFPADMDESRYEAMHAAGALHIVTARKEGVLVGYVIAFVMPHFHYKSAGLVALTDMYYVVREHRHGAGVKLFLAFERTLKARGVVRAHTSCKVHSDRQELFERLGWEFTDKTFSRVLNP